MTKALKAKPLVTSCPRCRKHGVSTVAVGNEEIERLFGWRYEGRMPQSWCHACRSKKNPVEFYEARPCEVERVRKPNGDYSLTVKRPVPGKTTCYNTAGYTAHRLDDGWKVTRNEFKFQGWDGKGEPWKNDPVVKASVPTLGDAEEAVLVHAMKKVWPPGMPEPKPAPEPPEPEPEPDPVDTSGFHRLITRCSLANPPTYVTRELYYFDGNSVDKWGREYDTRRKNLYTAESVLEEGQDLKTWRQVEKFFDRVVTSSYVERRFGDVSRIRLEKKTRGGWSHCRDGYRVRISTAGTHHWRKWVVIHEICHALVGFAGRAKIRSSSMTNRRSHPGHGRLFCAVYLDMIGHFLGKDARKRLLNSFRKHNVKYSPYRDIKVEAHNEYAVPAGYAA